MCNIVNGNSFPADIVNLHEYLSERNNSSVFHRPCSCTNYFNFSYVPSVRNTLPVHIRSSSSVSVFYCTWLMSCISIQLFTCRLSYSCEASLRTRLYLRYVHKVYTRGGGNSKTLPEHLFWSLCCSAWSVSCYFFKREKKSWCMTFELGKIQKRTAWAWK